mgnify:CR=1 FL=1
MKRPASWPAALRGRSTTAARAPLAALRWVPRCSGRRPARGCAATARLKALVTFTSHAAELKAMCHQRGLRLMIEPYDMNPAGDLDLGAERQLVVEQ